MANLTNSAKLIEEMEKKANSSSLAAVATSGSYTDLSNKPAIPTVNNSTIAIQKNGSAVDSFTTNAAAGKTINIQLTKSDVGLGNVDNTSDANKPISNATQTALNAKANVADVYTQAQVDSAISAAVSAVYKYKGSVANYASLPVSGQVVGDVWNVEDTGDNYAWAGTAWDKLAGTVDLSNYLTKTEASTTYLTQTAASTNYATKSEVEDAIAEVDGISTTQPTNPVAGSTYYNTTTNSMMVYDGSSWVEVGAGVKVQKLTQAEYDALTPAQKAEDIVYLITGSGPGGTIIAGGIAITQPASPTIGSVYFNTTTGTIMVYNGSTWLEAGSGNVIAMTQAEYDALPAATQTDGKLRIITDAPSIEMASKEYVDDLIGDLETALAAI